MTPKTKTQSGLSIHCHHNTLVEFCYNYKERVDYIKRVKPAHEQKTRLSLFKILPKEAEKDLPKGYLQAYRARQQADQAWKQAGQAWQQAYQAWKQTYQA